MEGVNRKHRPAAVSVSVSSVSNDGRYQAVTPQCWPGRHGDYNVMALLRHRALLLFLVCLFFTSICVVFLPSQRSRNEALQKIVLETQKLSNVIQSADLKGVMIITIYESRLGSPNLRTHLPSCLQTPVTSHCSVSPQALVMMISPLTPPILSSLALPNTRPWSPLCHLARLSWLWAGSALLSTGYTLTSASSSGTWAWAAMRGTSCPNSAMPPPSSALWSSLNGQSKS